KAFDQIIPSTFFVIFGKMFGAEMTAIAAWMNPVLASTILPATGLITASLLRMKEKFTGIMVVVFLFVPTFFVYGFSAFWSMGMGVILFSLVFTFSLAWLIHRKRSYLALVFLFFVGVGLTHPLSGLISLMTIISVLAYAFTRKD